ncbi:hypothetical protein EVAR_88605_1 [Eumeta japonica]|uniref:Uncharacterized protein n=1 Tax=Eumeta variegata TaxID=151549 RepID=A0A4C2A6I5_EUMVA|nr:hypothetical protein EVAR_88605_1 [Eumeta japonica]
MVMMVVAMVVNDSSYVQADAPSMNCTGIGESVADFSKPLTHGEENSPRGSNQSRHEKLTDGALPGRLPRVKYQMLRHPSQQTSQQ